MYREDRPSAEHVARITAKLAAATPYITALSPPSEDTARPAMPVVRLVPSAGDAAAGNPFAGPKDVDDEWS